RLKRGAYLTASVFSVKRLFSLFTAIFEPGNFRKLLRNSSGWKTASLIVCSPEGCVVSSEEAHSTDLPEGVNRLF
ncbi:hypothetical protein, partial [Marinobacterium mangrovicola]|uniref:hypothetical protein n=1 Tax=Marinobacterium mangrovicola TaxID=1476959 RepID=UPI001A9F16AD